VKIFLGFLLVLALIVSLGQVTVTVHEEIYINVEKVQCEIRLDGIGLQAP
jgi:hypothetical protein